MRNSIFGYRVFAAALLGSTALYSSLPLSQANAACVPISATPTLITIGCTGATVGALPITTLPSAVPPVPQTSGALILGIDGNIATITNTTANAVDLTATGAAGNFISLDTGNVGAPSSITGSNNGVSIVTTGGADILIGQNSAGGAGLNANVTGQNGNGIFASAALGGSVNVSTAPGTLVSGTGAGILMSVVNGPANLVFNGDVTTTNAPAFFDIAVTSTGTGAITIGGSGNALAGGIVATASGLGGITIQGSGNTTDLANGPGILAEITNPANAAAIQISRSGFIVGAFDGITATTAGTGPINVATSGAVTGNDGYGIRTSTNSGLTTVDIGSGSTVTGTLGALKLLSTGGDIVVNNAGLLVGAVNVSTSGVDPTINNSGTINGPIAVFGDLTLNNAGTVNGNVSATGVSTINNAGTISLVNGLTTDVLSTTNFVGQGGVFAIDVNPTSTAATQRADVLQATNLSGATNVAIAIIGPSGLIANPIPVVNAASVAPGTTVTLANNPGGLINYAIEQSGGTYNLISTVNTSATSATPTGIDTILTALNTGFFQNASAFIAEPPDPGRNQWNGGPWIRFATGQNDVSVSTSAQNPTGTTTAQSKVRANYSGFQTGIDLGVANIEGSGWNTHLGVTAGQVILKTNDLIGLNISSAVQVPFIGIYGALTGHNFFADFQVRQDFYDLRITNQAALLNGSSLNGKALAANVSAGYRFDLPSSWFFEPSAAFMYSNLRVDSLRVGLDSAGTSFGSLVFDPFLSLLGRLGARAGTSFVLEQYQLALQPFATASVWREFAGDSNTTFVTPGASSALSVTRIGTFGQVGLGVSGQVLTTGLLGFVRGDYRFGDHINGYAVVGGMRYQF